MAAEESPSGIGGSFPPRQSSSWWRRRPSKVAGTTAPSPESSRQAVDHSSQTLTS
jgi:hypothetical protein